MSTRRTSPKGGSEGGSEGGPDGDQLRPAAVEVQGAAAASAEAFDTRLARLEALVTELEGGGLGLEAAIDRYREGVSLLRGCRTTLTGFQRQVEELGQEASGARPYPGDPDVGDAP